MVIFLNCQASHMVSIKIQQKRSLSTVPFYASNTLQYSHLPVQPTLSDYYLKINMNMNTLKCAIRGLGEGCLGHLTSLSTSQ